MIRKLVDRLGDLHYTVRWFLAWRFGRKAGRAAIISLTCQRCGAEVVTHLACAAKVLRLHDKSHALLSRLEAEGGIRDVDIDELLEADGD